MSASSLYQKPSDLPNVLPLFPLTGVLLLPQGQLPLNVFEPRYLAMINNTMSADRIIGIIQPEDYEAAAIIDDAKAKPPLKSIGCAGRITSFAQTRDGRILITLTGICRFQVVKELDNLYPYRLALIDYKPYTHDLDCELEESEVDRQQLIDVFKSFVEAQNLPVDWDTINAASTRALVNALSMASPYGLNEKQALLEAKDLKTRAEALIALTDMALKENAITDKPILQ